MRPVENAWAKRCDVRERSLGGSACKRQHRHVSVKRLGSRKTRPRSSCWNDSNFWGGSQNDPRGPHSEAEGAWAGRGWQCRKGNEVTTVRSLANLDSSGASARSGYSARSPAFRKRNWWWSAQWRGAGVAHHTRRRCVLRGELCLVRWATLQVWI
jgi:hypothetical protein